MKKILGLFLSIVVTVSIFSGIDTVISAPVANATNNIIPAPSGPPSLDEDKQNVNTVNATIEADTPQVNQPRQELGPNGAPSPPLPPPPAPPKASCETYNGSYRYPVDSPATCSGTITTSSGKTIPFTCPANSKGQAAIYVEYEEKKIYETTYYEGFKTKSNLWEWWPIQGTNWATIDFSKSYSLNGKWYKPKAVQAYKTDRWTYGGKDNPPIVSPWFYNNKDLKNWTNVNPFQSYSWYKVFFEATAPEVFAENVQCRYPYKPEVGPLYYVTCLLYYDSSFYQAQNKDAIRYGGSLLDSRNGIKAGSVADINKGRSNNFGVNAGNHLQCSKDSFVTQEEYSLKSPETGGYGYYRLSAQVYATNCFLSGYPAWTHDRSKDVITGCTDPFQWKTFHSYAVYSCSGFNATGQGSGAWAALPNGVNFAVSACETFGCTVSGSLQIGDTSSPIQVMRNGENINVTYPSITVQASGNSRPANGAATWEAVTEAASGVVDGSSPFYGSTTNNSKQYFNLRTADDKSVNFLNARSGDAVNANNSNPSSAWQSMLLSGVANPNYSKGFVRYNWASNNGQNWKMFRSFRVHGEFYVPIASSSDGSTSMGWQKEIKYCGNVISNPVTVVRSINELQQ